jgi:hypothetical protein
MGSLSASSSSSRKCWCLLNCCFAFLAISFNLCAFSFPKFAATPLVSIPMTVPVPVNINKN